jgi:hypothetical protein
LASRLLCLSPAFAAPFAPSPLAAGKAEMDDDDDVDGHLHVCQTSSTSSTSHQDMMRGLRTRCNLSASVCMPVFACRCLHAGVCIRFGGASWLVIMWQCVMELQLTGRRVWYRYWSNPWQAPLMARLNIQPSVSSSSHAVPCMQRTILCHVLRALVSRMLLWLVCVCLCVVGCMNARLHECKAKIA